MADLKTYADKLPAFEGPLGKFTQTKNDMGGATNCGVTMNTFIGYRKKKGLPTPALDDLRNLKYPEWLDILKTMFWDEWQASEINNQSIAECLVEWFWGSGYWGIKIPQRLLGVKDDGIPGPATIQKINEQDPEKFHQALVNAKISFINNLITEHPEQAEFKDGWLRRINSFQFKP